MRTREKYVAICRQAMSKWACLSIFSFIRSFHPLYPFICSSVCLFVCSFQKIAVYKRAVRQQSYNRPLSPPSKSIESIASSPDNANGSANRLPTREPTSELESQLADQTKQTENSSNELRTVRIGRAGSSNNANGNRWKIIGQFLLIIHPNID